MKELIQYWVEFEQWGGNALTLSFLATVLLSIFDGYGLWDQAQKIKKSGSIKSIGTIWFMNQMFVFAQFLVYGVYIRSLALTVHGLEFFLHLPIIVLIWKYQWKESGFSRWEKFWLVAFVLTTAAIIALPGWRTELFSAMYLSRLPAFMNKPWAIWKARSTGVVSIKMVLIFLAGSVFWIIYAFTFGTSFILKFMSVAIGVILLITLLLWLYFYFKEKKDKISSWV